MMQCLRAIRGKTDAMDFTGYPDREKHSKFAFAAKDDAEGAYRKVTVDGKHDVAEYACEYRSGIAKYQSQRFESASNGSGREL